MDDLSFLVLDEADRMVQQGHFEARIPLQIGMSKMAFTGPLFLQKVYAHILSFPG